MKPVAAGNAVAGPIVEVFVRDHRLDAAEIKVGRGRRRSEDVSIVEDVETFVLHRPHVEGGDGDDHEDVEVVFPAESFLVPAHRALEAVHSVKAAILFPGLYIDLKLNLTAGHGGEAVFHVREIAAHQREQIGRFFERIVPHGEMPPGAWHVASSNEIAVGQQHRRLAFVGFDAGGVDRHHVRSVEEISDAAKALGFTLGAISVARAVKPHELCIVYGIDDCFDVEFEWTVRRLCNGEPIRSDDEVFRRQRLAVDRQRSELQVFAVENERRRRAGRVGFDLELGAYSGRLRMERHVEVDRLDQPVGRAVILQQNGAVFFGAHDRLDVEALWHK